jgi:hypothetical protein
VCAAGRRAYGDTSLIFTTYSFYCTGDSTLLGVEDWAESTCFSFPKPDVEPTEIRVKANHEFVVVLQVWALSY